MSKFANLLGRKPAEAAPAASTTPASERNVIELDQELFFPIATQLGEDNETVRNLLIDAEHKISELETIKRAVGKLVDPVSKTLRAFEETKNQKIGLQTQLNSTRAAFAKQRDELETAQMRLTALEAEHIELRELLGSAQERAASLEGTNIEQIAELNARRAQIVDLQRILQQLTSDLQIARDENSRLAERVAFLEKRMVQLEADTNAATHKLALAEQESATVDGLLQKSL